MLTIASGETDPAKIAQAFRTIPPPGTLARNMVVLDDNAKLPAVDGSQLTNIPYRTTLSAARSYFVRTDGSDSNTGLANTAGGAFLTIQKAVNTVRDTIDLNGQSVTINVAAGTYTGAVVLYPLVGSGSVTISGDVTTPSNVVISTTSADCISGSSCGVGWNVQGFKFTSATGGHAINATGISLINVTGKVDFGSVANSHVAAIDGGIVQILAPYNITAAPGGFHWITRRASGIIAVGLTITITGTPAFPLFSYADTGSRQSVSGNTFSGSATGQRFSVLTGGGIDTNGGGANYLPGNSAGTTTSPGWYA